MSVHMSFTVVADAMNQMIYTLNIRHEDQTLLCLYLYQKIPVEILRKSI